MTSLLSSAAPRDRVTPGGPTDPRRRRPVLVLSVVAGLVAAGATLLACAGLGLVGWFLSDTGAHGAPRDALRAGTGAWLVAHGSGLTVRGAAVTLVPLGLSLVAAWTTWRVGHRLGESLWGHGPDAHRLADGERDWTVPVAAGGFLLGYASVAVLALRTAGADLGGSWTSLAPWVLALCLLVAAPAIAAGSGRAAIWVAGLPHVVRHGAATARAVVRTHLAVSAALLAVAFLLDFGAAANMVERLGTSPGETVLLILATLALVPNAVLCASAFLAGPGFVVGGATLVSPSAVVLGPLPVLPLLAALPEEGSPTPLAGLVLAVPVLAAATATWRTQLRRPTLRWDHGALRGCGGGIVAGLVLTLLTSLAGGAAGPGRMRFVGPLTSEVLFHLVTAFGLGGLLGGLLATWWQRRTSVPVDTDEGPTPGH